MTVQTMLLKWKKVWRYGIIGCLLFISFLFLGIFVSNQKVNPRIEGNCDTGLSPTADEANITFSYCQAFDNIAELFETTYIWCTLENVGNATAYNISISLLSKLKTAPSFIIEQIQNCSPLGPSKGSSLIQFPVQKNVVGNYSYIINVCFNFTSGAQTYQKTLNSTILQILVVLIAPSVEFYGMVENGVTTLVVEFSNHNFYANLTYSLLIQRPNSAPEIFYIGVPGSLYNPSLIMRFDYVITFSIDQLDFWEKLISYWNNKIEREITLFYQVSVNDSTGTVHPTNINFYGSITVINSTRFSLPLSLETNSTDIIWYFIIIFLGIFGFQILRGRVGKKAKKPDVDTLKLAKNDQKIYVSGHLTFYDLATERKNLLTWLEPQKEYYFLYQKLEKIKYIRIGLAFATLSFLILVFIGIGIQMFILTGISALFIPISIGGIFILNKFEVKQFETVFLQYSRDHPEIQVISEGTSIYRRKYKSIYGFMGGFFSYSAIIGVILFLIISSKLHADLVTLISVLGGASFGLIFGLVFYTSVLSNNSSTFVLGIPISSTLGILYTIMFFDPNQVPFFIPMGIFMAIFLLGSYLLNRLINRIIEYEITGNIASDLTDYFGKYQSIYLRKWGWVSSPDHFPLLLQAIQRSGLDLELQEDKLIKKS